VNFLNFLNFRGISIGRKFAAVFPHPQTPSPVFDGRGGFRLPSPRAEGDRGREGPGMRERCVDRR